MEYHFYKFSAGADVYSSLNQLQIHRNLSSFIISAVGDLSKVSFKCPLNNKPIILEKKLEIINLSGYVICEKSHLHISVSDENCSVFGGHLMTGTTVLKSLDVLIGVAPNLTQKSISTANDSLANVDIYVLPDCPWSKRAMRLLEANSIKYNFYTITNNEEFLKISNRTYINTFPQIFIKNEFIGGYSELADLFNNGNLLRLIN
tara:strand:+ start:206 stop:817 length:612 start_codon:yes stop_codon:yes gene_type:complete